LRVPSAMDYNWKSQFFFAVRYENLFLVGRNGMHRYNNQDHPCSLSPVIRGEEL